MRGAPAVAYVWAYNEADVVEWTVRHLLGQGVAVHAIDNWSDDGTYEILQRLSNGRYVELERWPDSGPPEHASLGDMMRRTEELALAAGPHWAIHHDADEVLRSSRPGELVVGALTRLGAAGWTAVESRVQTYAPSEEFTAGADPEWTLTRLIPDHIDARTRHVRAWLQQPGVRVDLATRGGHFVMFPRIRVAPERLVMKHYPLRNADQAARKVASRRARWSPAERARGWHTHYDEARP